MSRYDWKKEHVLLLASSASVEGIEKWVNEYFCSQSWTVNPETLEMRNTSNGKTKENCRVIKKGRLYRFEMCLSS